MAKTSDEVAGQPSLPVTPSHRIGASDTGDCASQHATPMQNVHEPSGISSQPIVSSPCCVVSSVRHIDFDNDSTLRCPCSAAACDNDIAELAATSPVVQMAAKNQGALNDLGSHIGKPIDDYTRKLLLQNHWKPPKDYAFPFSLHKKNGKELRRHPTHDHLEKFEWLVLSDVDRGLYCKYCSLFVPGHVGGKHKTVSLQQLVSTPLTQFKNLLGKDGSLTAHAEKGYHVAAMSSGKEFLQRITAPEKSVENQVSAHRLALVNANRKKLEPIIKSIIFLGRQNIPLRGHRDDGTLMHDTEIRTSSTVVNEGNFRELLRFRMESGDKELEEHLSGSSSRETYVSKTTQNELISCCGAEISAIIIKRVQDSILYSIMFDETTDVAHESQLALVLRYVHDGMLREDFLQFVSLRQATNKRPEESDQETVSEPTVTGQDVGRTVLAILRSHGLNPKNCVGIGTDGCSTMVSEAKGAVTEVRKEATNAVRCPCYNHALNLSIAKSNEVQAVRNAVGVIKEVTAFFTASSKRNLVLKQTLGKQLPGLCETRWVERHQSVQEFHAALPKIAEALEKISHWRERQSASKAMTLLTAISDSHFIVALVVLANLLAHTYPLSKAFQKTSIDLQTAQGAVRDTLSVLSEKRRTSQSGFGDLFLEATTLAEELGTEFRLQRVPKRQAHCQSLPASDIEAYFRQTVYVPLLDNVLSDIVERFPSATLDIFQLFALLPASVNATNTALDRLVCSSLANKYSSVIGAEATSAEKALGAEYQVWAAKWIREEKSGTRIPSTALEAFNSCDKDMFPTLHVLLQVLATLPISVATAERSFSTLRRLKTWIRSTMGEERLLGLALLATHRDISLDVSRVIERFAHGGKRRLLFSMRV